MSGKFSLKFLKNENRMGHHPFFCAWPEISVILKVKPRLGEKNGDD
jgi:hypothetical protein